MEDKKKQERKEYMAEWRKKNRDRVTLHNENYVIKKYHEIMARREAEAEKQK